MGLGFVLGCTVLVELYVLRRLRFDWLTIGIVIAGTVLCADYLTYTSVSERNYDGSSHIEYIQALARGRLPDVFECGACGHPPAYYALAALWTSVLFHSSWLPFELTLQWLSLLLFFGFVVTALLIFRSCGVRPGTLRFAAALVVFWPSSIINSVRVHNDALASPLMLAAIYFVAQWDRAGRARDFYAALAACVLALCTKSSAYPVAASLVCFALLRLGSPALRRESLKLCAVAVVALSAAAVVPVALRESRAPTTLCQKVVGLACDGRYVPPVADTPSRFIQFDVAAFVRGLAAPGELPERDLFLNRLAKSSLFGVMPLGDELGQPRQRVLAPLLGVLLLAMGLLCLGALPFVRRKWAKQYRVYWATPLIMLAFLVAFRVRAPNEFHEDFRHIFPALVPFCLGYACVVHELGRASRLLRYGGAAIGLMLVAASTAFFARGTAAVSLAQGFDGFALDGKAAPVAGKKFGEALHVLGGGRHRRADAPGDARVEVVGQGQPVATFERVGGQQRHAPGPALASSVGNADGNAQRCSHHPLPDVSDLEEAAVTAQLVDDHALALGEDIHAGPNRAQGGKAHRPDEVRQSELGVLVAHEERPALAEAGHVLPRNVVDR